MPGNSRGLSYQILFEFATFYTDKFIQLNNEYRAGNQLQALASFDRERGQIEHAFKWISENWEDARQVGELACRLPLASDILRARQHPKDRLRWLKIGVAAAQTLRRNDERFVHFISTAMAYNELNEYGQSVEHLNLALKVAEEQNDSSKKVLIYTNLSVLHRLMDKPKKAAEFYKQANALGEQIGWENVSSETRNVLRAHLGAEEVGDKDYASGSEHFEALVEEARQTKNLQALGDHLLDLGETYRRMKESSKALTTLNEALSIANKLDAKADKGNCLYRLAQVYQRLGPIHSETAERCYHEALKIARELGNKHQEAVVLDALGQFCYKNNCLQESLAYFEESVSLFLEIGDTKQVKRVRSNHNTARIGQFSLVYMIKGALGKGYKCKPPTR